MLLRAASKGEIRTTLCCSIVTLIDVNRRRVVLIAAVAIVMSIICRAVTAAPMATKPLGPVLVPGIVGTAFLVDSQDHEFSFRTRGTFNPACGTVEFWVRPQREIGTEDVQGILYQTCTPEVYSSGNGLQLMFRNKGLSVCARHTSGTNAEKSFPVHFAPKSWHHIAFTWDGKTGRLYVDGKSRGSFPMKPLEGYFPWTYVGGVALHSYPWSYISNSAFDELRVSNVAISPDDVRRDYEAGLRHEPLTWQPGRTLLLNHCDQPAESPRAQSWKRGFVFTLPQKAICEKRPIRSTPWDRPIGFTHSGRRRRRLLRPDIRVIGSIRSWKGTSA